MVERTHAMWTAWRVTQLESSSMYWQQYKNQNRHRQWRNSRTYFKVSFILKCVFFYACVRSHNIDDGNAVVVLVVVVFFSIIFISGFNRPYFTGHYIACHFALLYIWSYIPFLAQSKWLILQRIENVDCFVLFCANAFSIRHCLLCVIFVFLFWLLSHSLSRSPSNRSIHLHSHFLHSDTVIYAINFPTFFTVNIWMVYVV